MSAKSLVTGGAGFIGCHVARELMAKGHAVTVLDDLSGGFLENVPRGCEFVEGSILDHEIVEELFARGSFDYVFHLAAYAAEGLSHFIKRFNYSNNLVGSVNLINASVNYGVKCFVFTSSIAVYGSGQTPMTEATAPIPEDPYGIAKYAVELDLANCHEMFGLDYIVFRPHNVYGEYQHIGDTYRNVIGIFMNQLMQNKPMSIFGDGEQTRAFSYIGDVAPVIARSVEVPEAYNEIFNIGADHPYTVNRLAETVASALGREANTVHLPARTEVTHAYSSHEKVLEVFGQQASWTLEDGVSRMAEWAKKEGPKSGTVFEAVEITKNLPPSWAKNIRGSTD